MSDFIDTSMIVRLFRQDLPEFADRAGEVIESDEELYLTEGTIAESAFVLASVYKLERAVILDQLIALIQRSNITVYGLDKRFVVQGLEFCRPSGRVSIPDALLWAAARSAGIPRVYTFDQPFPSDGVALRQDLP